MRNQQVNWSEGLFLRPHHFQSAERYWHEILAMSSQFDRGYSYGLHRLEVNLEALENQVVEVVRCDARTKFGSIFSVANSLVERVDLGKKLEGDKKFIEFLRERGGIRVYLGVPQLKLSRPNVQNGETDVQRRYVSIANQFEDEVTGGNPQDVLTRGLNLKILFECDDLDGFESVPLFRLVRSRDVDGKLKLDPEYYPPCLATSAFPEFQREIMEGAYDLLKSRGEILRRQVHENGWGFSTQLAGAVERVMMLRTVNEAIGALNCYSFGEGVHPFDAYRILCQIIGGLSVFGRDRGVADMPRYDHENLHGIFKWALGCIKTLLEIGDEGYHQRFFKGTGLARLGVQVEQEWFASKWQLILGIHSIDLSARDCLKMLDGPITWKLAQPTYVDYCYEKHARGLKLRSLKSAPSVLPRSPGWSFFSIAEDDLWDEVKSEGGIGLRINEQQIKNLKDLDNQQTISLEYKNTPCRVEFAIFAVRNN